LAGSSCTALDKNLIARSKLLWASSVCAFSTPMDARQHARPRSAKLSDRKAPARRGRTDEASGVRRRRWPGGSLR
jgi:hypothetical protein